MPQNFINWGNTNVSQIQGMFKEGHVFTVQAHPEFVGGVVKEIIKTRQEKQIFTPELAQKLLIAADHDDDSVWVGQKCVEFLTG